MTGMEYDASGLHAGASGHLDAAVSAEQLVTALARTEITLTMFGRAGAAARLAAALDLARQAEGRSAAAESTARADLAHRVHATAGLGDDLTTTTTSIAGTVRGSILDGM